MWFGIVISTLAAGLALVMLLERVAMQYHEHTRLPFVILGTICGVLLIVGVNLMVILAIRFCSALLLLIVDARRNLRSIKRALKSR
jgi:hypothetical protein